MWNTQRMLGTTFLTTLGFRIGSTTSLPQSFRSGFLGRSNADFQVVRINQLTRNLSSAERPWYSSHSGLILQRRPEMRLNNSLWTFPYERYLHALFTRGEVRVLSRSRPQENQSDSNSKWVTRKAFPGIGQQGADELIRAAGSGKGLVDALILSNTDNIRGTSRRLNSSFLRSVFDTWADLFKAGKLEETMIHARGVDVDLVNETFGDVLEYEWQVSSQPFKALAKVALWPRGLDLVDETIAERGITLTDEQKAFLALEVTLLRAGQVCLPITTILAKIKYAVSHKKLPPNILPSLTILTPERFGDILAQAPEETIAVNDGFAYVKRLLNAEQRLALLIADRLTSQEAKPAQHDDSVLNSDLSLSHEQMEALKKCLNSAFFILTGGPGTGKTHCLGKLLEAWKARGMKVAIATFTARSAQVIKERTGDNSATTIHKLLQAVPRRRVFQVTEVDCDVLVLDEASLIDLELMLALFSRLRRTTQVVLMGDPEQLGSIKPGSVLRDLLDSELSSLVSSAQLVQQRRQMGSESSAIHQLVMSVREGSLPGPDILHRTTLSALRHSILTNQVCYINELCYSPEVIQRVTAELLNAFPGSSIQVLAPVREALMNQGLKSLFRSRISSPNFDKELEGFVVGDRVMHLENDYDRNVMNGEVGRVIAIEETEVLADSDEPKKNSSRMVMALKVEYPDGNKQTKIIQYDKYELSDLCLAYAMTVHKAQGGEFPIVLVAWNGFGDFCTKQMLYTACSRAKERLVIIAKSYQLAMATKNNEVRHSGLIQAVLQAVSNRTLTDVQVHPGASLNVAAPNQVDTTLRAVNEPVILTKKKPTGRSKRSTVENVIVGPFAVDPPSIESNMHANELRRSFGLAQFDNLNMLDFLKRLCGFNSLSTSSVTNLVLPISTAKKSKHRSGESGALKASEFQNLAQSPRVVAPFNLARSILPQELAKNAKNPNDAQTIGDDVTTVKSAVDASVTYQVNRTKRTCTCPGFRHRGMCKHLNM